MERLSSGHPPKPGSYFETLENRRKLNEILGGAGTLYFKDDERLVKQFMALLARRHVTLDQRGEVRRLFDLVLERDSGGSKKLTRSTSLKPDLSVSKRRARAKSLHGDAGKSEPRISAKSLRADNRDALDIILFNNQAYSALSEEEIAGFIQRVRKSQITPGDLNAVRRLFRVFLEERIDAQLASATPIATPSSPTLLRGMTPLIGAVLQRDQAQLKKRLAEGENPTKCCPLFRETLSDEKALALRDEATAFLRNVDKVVGATEAFVEEGILEFIPKLVDGVTDDFRVNGCNALTAAIALGARTEFIVMLAGWVDPVSGKPLLETYDDRGETALTTAILAGDVGAVGLLLDLGANPSFPNARGRSPLSVAIGKGFPIEQLLYSRGARSFDEDTSGLPLVHAAIEAGDITFIRILVEQGIDLSQLDAAQRTPLVVALDAGNLEAVDLLLRAGASPLKFIWPEDHEKSEMRKVGRERSPIHRACEHSNEMASRLMDAVLDYVPESFGRINHDRTQGYQSPNFNLLFTCLTELRHRVSLGEDLRAKPRGRELAEYSRHWLTQILKLAAKSLNPIDLFHMICDLDCVDINVRREASLCFVEKAPHYFKDLFREVGQRGKRSRGNDRLMGSVSSLCGKGDRPITKKVPGLEQEFDLCAQKCLTMAVKHCRFSDYPNIFEIISLVARPEEAIKYHDVMLKRIVNGSFRPLAPYVKTWCSTSATETRFATIASYIASAGVDTELKMKAHECLTQIWTQAWEELSPPVFAKILAHVPGITKPFSAPNTSILKQILSTQLKILSALRRSSSLEGSASHFCKALALSLIVKDRAAGPALLKAFLAMPTTDQTEIVATLPVASTAHLMDLLYRHGSPVKTGPGQGSSVRKPLLASLGNRLTEAMSEVVLRKPRNDLKTLSNYLTACFEKAQPFGSGLQLYGDSFKSIIRVLTAEQRKTLMSKMAPEHRTRLLVLMPDDEAAALLNAVPLSLAQ